MRAGARPEASSRARASARSFAQGWGSRLDSRLAMSARDRRSAGLVFSWRGAVSSRWTAPSRSPASRVASAALISSRQRGAEVQPLSMTISKGPLPAPSVLRAPGAQTGWDRPTIAAMTARVRISQTHQGVRAGVSSRGSAPSSRRSDGSSASFGAGGVARSTHQISGSAISAASAQGAPSRKGPIAVTAPPRNVRSRPSAGPRQTAPGCR